MTSPPTVQHSAREAEHDRNRARQEATTDPAPAPQGGARPHLSGASDGAVTAWPGDSLPATPSPVHWTQDDVDLATDARARGVNDASILRWLGKPAGSQIPARPRDVIPRIPKSAQPPRALKPRVNSRPRREPPPRAPRHDAWTEAELGAAATAYADGASVAEIAAWLGRPSGAAVRTMLRTRGVIVPERSRQPDWTEEDDLNLETWFREGKSRAVIARRLGRTETAVRVRLKRVAIRVGFSLVQARPWTMRQLALLMGVDNKTVTVWCDQGGLRFTWGWRTPAVGPEGPRAHRGRVRLISEQALTDWMEDPNTWHLWRVDRITDEGWREHAEGVRFDADWLTVGEVADMVGVAIHTVNQWIHKGLFDPRGSGDGRWGPRRTGNGGNWLINLDDLHGFVAPVDRPDPDAMRTRMLEVLDQHPAGCFELEDGESPASLEALQRALWDAARLRRLNVTTRRTQTALYFVQERAS